MVFPDIALELFLATCFLAAFLVVCAFMVLVEDIGPDDIAPDDMLLPPIDPEDMELP
jgi:hypothetical protein